MTRVVELEVPPASDHLALIRLVVAAAARLGRALPDRRIDDLRLAVSEACANAIDGQRATGSSLPVRVVVELTDDRVAVTITDHGGGFEPSTPSPMPAATDPDRLGQERGLGVPLMRSLADEVTFAPTADGTAVRLVVEGPDGA